MEWDEKIPLGRQDLQDYLDFWIILMNNTAKMQEVSYERIFIQTIQ